MDKKGTIIGVLLLIIFIILCILFRSCYKLNKTTELYETINSELIQTTNKLGQEESKRIAYESDISTFLSLKAGLDSLSKELQNVVKSNKNLLKNSGSATIIEGETKIDNSTITNITYTNDSFPIYNSKFSNEWINYTIKSSKDTTNLDLLIENKYTVLIGEESQGLFKKSKIFSIVTNHNPYTKTTDMRTYSVSQPKPKKLGLGISIGYGINGLGFQPYLGIGLNYNLVEIK